MIPAKTKWYLSISSWNNTEVGIQELWRTGKSGIVCDFFIHTDASSTGGTQVVAMKIVFLIGWKFAQARELSTFLWQLVLHHVINAKLKKEGILTIVTFRTNAIVECPSETKKLINKGEEVEITERIRKQVFVW